MRILVVDDDAGVRKALNFMFTDYGHEVVECWNGLQGLATFERKGPFDAVLSDGQMPGLTGPEMTAQIRALDPNVPIVLLSGDSGMAAKILPTVTFLEKGHATLAQIRAALGLEE
jgi:CheY-like chemotaxis protein